LTEIGRITAFPEIALSVTDGMIALPGGKTISEESLDWFQRPKTPGRQNAIVYLSGECSYVLLERPAPAIN
jgi:hypothetical protein